MREATTLVGETIDIADRAWSGWLLLRLVRAALAAGELDRARRWAHLATDRARLPRDARAGPGRRGRARARPGRRAR